MEKSMMVAVVAVIISVASIFSSTILRPATLAPLVTTDELADGAVTGDKIAGNTITDINLTPAGISRISSGAVRTEQIADNAITAEKIAENAIPEFVIEDNTITSAKIVDDNVTSADIQDGTITDADITAVGISRIANDAVTTDKVANGAITSTKIQNGAVTADKMGKVQAYVENEYSLSWTTPGGWTWMTFPAMSITITTATTCDVLVLFDHCVSSNVAGAQSRVAILADGTVVAISAVNTPTANLDWYQTQALHTTLTNVIPGTHTYHINWGTPDAATFQSARRHMTVLALPAG